MPPKSVKCQICDVRYGGTGVRREFMTKFPLDEDRCRKWVKVVGNEDLVYVPIEKLHAIKFVCGMHFIKTDFNRKKNRLKKHAVPSVHLKLPPLPDHLLLDFPCHVFSHTVKTLKKDVPNATHLFHITTSQDSTRVVYTNRRIHIDHSYVKTDDSDKWMEQLAFASMSGKGSTESPNKRKLREGEPHNDHTYVVKTKTLYTLPVGEPKIREARDCGNPVARIVQIEAAPEIEPAPELPEDATFDADDDAQTAPLAGPEVKDSGEETLFSWQKTELIEADEPEAPLPAPAPAPAPLLDATLALFWDSDPEPEPEPDFQPDQAVPSGPAPKDKEVENRCKDCGEVNEGFEFWCVQCGGGALCGACAARPPHHAHYVLRAPVGATRTVTQAVLAVIRQQLQNENLLSPHETIDDGLKVEVKEEPAETPPAEPDPLACEPHEPHETQEPHEPHSSRESNSSPSPDKPHSPPEPATHDADKGIVKKIINPYEPLTLPRLRKAIDHAHKENLILPTQRKLIKVPPAQVKHAFFSHIERIVTTQQMQLKLSQPPIKHTSQTIKENLVSTQHNKVGGSPTHGRTSTDTTQHEQLRGLQAPIKVTSEPKPSETVIIDLDDVADEETIEYLEEGLESDIETLDEHLLDEHEEDVLDGAYLVDEDLSDEDRIVGDIARRGVKRKNDAEETLPVRGSSESMVRALPSKAVVQVRPLSSLEIRNWTVDRKRLKKD